MSGTRQTEFTLSGQSTDWANPDAVRIYVERIFEPTFKKVRNTVNQLARDILSTAASTTVAAKYGVVFVDATAGNVTLTLVTPADNFHPITVVKVDSSAHTVAVQASGGALISGAATDTLLKQWEVAQYESDSTKYARTFGGNMSLFGDVTGRADSNTISFIQAVPVDMVTTPPVEGARIIYHNGKIVPAAVKINPIDNRLSNAGLWSFDLSPAATTVPDLSGNGNDLSVESGTLRTASIYPQIGGVLFDGATVLVAPSSAVLRITAAMTLSMLFFWSDLPAGGALRTFVSHGILPGSGASPTNYLYRWAMTNLNQGDYFTQHGANVASFAQTNSTIPRAQVGLVTITRDGGGVLKHYLNGIFAGSSFGTITLPTDGSSGRFRVGGEQGVVNPFTGVVLSIRVSNNVTADADILAEYNYTLGGVYGYR